MCWMNSLGMVPAAWFAVASGVDCEAKEGGRQQELCPVVESTNTAAHRLSTSSTYSLLLISRRDLQNRHSPERSAVLQGITWVLHDKSTWASAEADPLCGDDERMLIASAPLTSIWQAPAASGPGSTSDCSGSGVGEPLPEFAHAHAKGRPSALSLRPATPAERSVKAFLKDPEVLACVDVGDEVSAGSDSGDDEDIPDVLRVQPSLSGWPGIPRSGSQVWMTSSPGGAQACRGLRNRVDGLAMSPRTGGAEWCDRNGGKEGLRPQTAPSRVRVLSAREKLDRRKGYKAPTPSADAGHMFFSPAKPRFRM